ncbi:hypothetical protein BT63DRAFT_166875 [Microthyrium microscopicum]|uniref:EthD domain-containing protein n=1 Tax=Microthyrium microscopicum TaxID=703497 RepID=A0A6A6UPT4_9PEZI|nr:hypothetical protein BT63DRAFT_166875 [Microthyrium microscopicum]
MRLTTLAGLLSFYIAVAYGLAEPKTTGLLFVASRPTHPELTEDVFNQWYNKEHLPNFINKNISDLAVRYKNTNTSAEYPYLAVYRIDVEKLKNPLLLTGLTFTSQLLPGKTNGTKGGSFLDVMKMDMRMYSRIQTFEGQTPEKSRGKGLITLAMEPTAGTEKEVDDWYRLQHLDMFRYCSTMAPKWYIAQIRLTRSSMLKGYHRSTRYQKLDNSSPRFLAMHEFDTTSIPAEMKMLLNTEWAKKIVAGTKSSERNVWEWVAELGKGKAEEKF